MFNPSSSSMCWRRRGGGGGGGGGGTVRHGVCETKPYRYIPISILSLYNINYIFIYIYYILEYIV